jgi:hypothetical protein
MTNAKVIALSGVDGVGIDGVRNNANSKNKRVAWRRRF